MLRTIAVFYWGNSSDWTSLTACHTVPPPNTHTFCVVINDHRQSPEVGDFYGTGIEIWAGFGPKGWLSCLHSFKIFWPMWHIKNIQNLKKKLQIFYRLRNIFNCVLPQWRHLTAGLLYNDFDFKFRLGQGQIIFDVR